MVQICRGFFSAPDCVETGGLAAGQTFKLGKHKPHPMGVLMSAAEFVECLGVGVLLGDHESMKTKWIFSHFERIFSCERITERINKLSLGRSVCDGKDDIGKRPAELGFDRLPEIVRRALREEKRGQTLHFSITLSSI